jgi:hypothetical protein
LWKHNYIPIDKLSMICFNDYHSRLITKILHLILLLNNRQNGNYRVDASYGVLKFMSQGKKIHYFWLKWWSKFKFSQDYEMVLKSMKNIVTLLWLDDNVNMKP